MPCLAAIAILASSAGAVPHPERLAQIRTVHNTANVLWKAKAHDKFALQAPGASKPLCGVKGDWKKDLDRAIARGDVQRYASVPQDAQEIPESFDSETNWPQCAKVIDDIRDQSNCGCCWAFGAAEAASDRMCIATNASMQVTLSAQDICFCASSDGCGGGSTGQAWIYLKTSGVVSGGQYQGSGASGSGLCSDYTLPHCHHHGPQGIDPYPAEGDAGCPSFSSPSCPTKCDSNATGAHSDFASDKYIFNGQTIGTGGGDIKAAQQLIMASGPVETVFDVYTDFEDYSSGIYHHVTGKQVGAHAVKIVGWGSENGVNYWKVANSWNKFWGEKGYFRIRFGDCDIDYGVQGTSLTGKWSKKGGSSIAV